MKNKFFTLFIAILSLALGIFFIYKGINKHFLSPCKVYESSSTIPIEYQNLITSLCTTGFTKIVGALQVVSGILLVLPRTRLLGSMILLPVIINIFLFHLILDNRPHELVETGIPLLATILIFASFYKKWKVIIS
ncbi:MAG: DoxX family protein [Flavobacteriaceae bacterium]